VSASPDFLHEQLALFRNHDDVVPSYYFWWNASDSLIYSGTQVGGQGSGPMIVSHAERFQFIDTFDGVRVDLRLRSAGGDLVEAGSFAVKQNR
jgi:hypothetical protein